MEKISCYSFFCLVVHLLCDFHEPSPSVQLGSFLYSAIALFLGKKTLCNRGESRNSIKKWFLKVKEGTKFRSPCERPCFSCTQNQPSLCGLKEQLVRPSLWLWYLHEGAGVQVELTAEPPVPTVQSESWSLVFLSPHVSSDVRLVSRCSFWWHLFAVMQLHIQAHSRDITWHWTGRSSRKLNLHVKDS